jgi:hypothetical protein
MEGMKGRQQARALLLAFYLLLLLLLAKNKARAAPGGQMERAGRAHKRGSPTPGLPSTAGGRVQLEQRKTRGARYTYTVHVDGEAPLTTTHALRWSSWVSRRAACSLVVSSIQYPVAFAYTWCSAGRPPEASGAGLAPSAQAAGASHFPY